MSIIQDGNRKIMTKMKNVYYLLFVLALIAGCELDNYDAPNVTLSGKVIDSETNELVENGGVNNGTRIHLFEGSSTQPIMTNSYPDGHFVNAALFQGNYKLVALGAFEMVDDTIHITMEGNTTADVKVIPNLRLKATLQDFDGTTATVSVDYSKVAEEQTLNQLALVWSTINNPNMFTFFGGGQQTMNVASENLTTGEVIFTITGLKPETTYYIRAAGATNNSGNYYNYSATLKIP